MFVLAAESGEIVDLEMFCEGGQGIVVFKEMILVRGDTQSSQEGGQGVGQFG